MPVVDNGVVTVMAPTVQFSATVVIALALSGCVSTVDGAAMRAEGEPDPVSLLQEQDLEDVLLDEAELNDVLGSTEVEVFEDLYEMTDDSADISEPDCIGAVFSAEEPVYAPSRYTGVHSRLAEEADNEFGFFIEQAVVAMPSVEAATGFLDGAAQTWRDCTETTLLYDSGDDSVELQLRGVIRDGAMIGQRISVVDGGWECEHTMAAVNNAIVEVFVCGVQPRDYATRMVTRMVANVGDP